MISGGAGYIGTHTAVELVGAGFGVVIIDDFSNSDAAAVEGVRRITGVDVPFEQVDTCNEEALRAVFRKYEFDSVIHFAASKAVGESVQKPMLYYRNNLTSLMNIIDLMREFGRSNIVFPRPARSTESPTNSPSPNRRPANRPRRLTATRNRFPRICSAIRSPHTTD